MTQAPGPYDPSGDYAKVMTSVVKEENDKMSSIEVEDTVKRHWTQWAVDQGEVQPEGSDNVPANMEQDYGFAKTPNYSFFPATRERHCTRSNKIKVQFLATGTTAFVPIKDWQEYSAEAAAMLLLDKNANRGSFSTALKILESRIAALRGEIVEEVAEGACTVLAQQPRKLGALSNSKLTTEKTFNNAAFKAKMYQKAN